MVKLPNFQDILDLFMTVAMILNMYFLFKNFLNLQSLYVKIKF